MDKWRGALAFSLLIALALAGSAGAQLPDPKVTFIPDQISANSSFVMIVDPGTDDPVRVTWQACDITCQFGSLPLVNDKYMCYFSDTDPKSTCGPVPFRFSMEELGLPYEIEVSTIDADGRLGNRTVLEETGGLKIVPEITKDFDSGVASMLVWIDKPAESVSYMVYDSSFNEKTSGYLPMEKIQATPYYNASVELDPGVYYIAFRAVSADDFGGGMEKVDMLGFGGPGVTEGVIRADPIDIDVLFEAGTMPALPMDKKVYNTINQTFDGISIILPAEISRYVTLTIPNSTLTPYKSVFYTINLRNVVSSLDIDTVAEIRSGAGTKLGQFPVKMKVSYVGGSAVGSCDTGDDGDYCLGGICCSGSCRAKAECCVDSDCSSGRCSASFRCEAGRTDMGCLSGTCLTGYIACPAGKEETGTCVSGGDPGICCASSVTGECSGADDGDSCSLGVCCYDECVSGECCTSFDCPVGESCRSGYCEADTDGGGGMDYTLLLIVAAIAAAGGVGAWYYFTKVRKPKSAEDRFEDEEKDVFDDEEFY